MPQNKTLPTLDARLSTAAGLVLNGSVAADMGCDHGKLSAVLSTKCKKVIAVDSNESPLSVARAQMEKSGVTNVECRLGNGLLALSENEVNAIVIAGLSAKTICDILAAAPWVKNSGCRLILVPATKPHELRAHLYAEGFTLAADIPVKASGRYYAVIAAEYCGFSRVLTPLESVLGSLTGVHKAEYLKKEAAKLSKTAKSAEFSHYSELAKEVMKEAIEC